MPKPTLHAEQDSVKVVIVTLDGHLASAVARSASELRKDIPGLSLSLHAASEWGASSVALQNCKAAIAEADIIVACMLFVDEHIKAVQPALEARRDDCDAAPGARQWAPAPRHQALAIRGVPGEPRIGRRSLDLGVPFGPSFGEKRTPKRREEFQ